MCQGSGTPFSSRSPTSWNENPLPAVRSLTVREARISDGTCQGGDASADRDREPRVLAVDDLTLAGMDPRTDLDPELTDAIHDVESTADPARWSVEGRIETVARGVVLDALPLLQCFPNDGVVTTGQLGPRPVAQGCLVRRRASTMSVK